MDKKAEFLKKILATFKVEAEENIDLLAANLVELEQEVTDERKDELIEIIYRSAHSLKGASRAVNLTEIESICHAFEDVMSAVRSKEIQFNTQVFDVLHSTVNLITDVLNCSNIDEDEDLNIRIAGLIDDLSLVEAGIEIDEVNIPDYNPDLDETVIENDEFEIPETKGKEALVEEVEPKVAEKVLEDKKERVEKVEKKNVVSKPIKSKETIRVSTKKLDSLLFQSEEMLALKLSAIQRTENLQRISSSLMIWKKEALNVFSSTQNIKQLLHKNEKEKNVSAIDKDSSKVIQFYDWANSHIRNVEKELNELRNFSHQEAYLTGAKIENLLNDVRDLITVPFSSLLGVFPKMIRDIAKDLGKGVNFVIEGDDIEIDRRILEKLRNPLMHIFRNSIDYGIETPEIRTLNNKDPKGNIKIKIEQLENNKVQLVISDDGAGIDTKKLKALYKKARNMEGDDDANITEEECLNYIFQSGVSTSEIVTDLSGRGLGLAIVREEIENIGGSIVVHSEKDISTTFKILLPISIVTFRGVLIEVAGSRFIVPTSKVIRGLRLNRNEIKTIENKTTITFNNQVIPLVKLSDILELASVNVSTEYLQLVVFENANNQMAFEIDRFIGEQEVLAKNFNKQLTRVRNISGATVLGSGTVVPILNISDLFKSAHNSNGYAPSIAENDQLDENAVKSVLVVEDSITSRMLIKNILEAAGYVVTTAIDGVEGFTKLQEGEFSVVVSDVEMPRMNGFELTAKIRSNKKTANIPIILITSLSKREDKEKGIDAGANAYIVKSSFDQSNLLEILDRFI
ncbi:MAG: hybrid sensor histidine kinase/response regulator [Bacteroidetes bacterium 4572_77]|nr:MAG: hybrid sensor histidine kinase/response regulator [Bacteroidetes bacterium 4572_77]